MWVPGFVKHVWASLLNKNKTIVSIARKTYLRGYGRQVYLLNNYHILSKENGFVEFSFFWALLQNPKLRYKSILEKKKGKRRRRKRRTFFSKNPKILLLWKTRSFPRDFTNRVSGKAILTTYLTQETAFDNERFDNHFWN